MRTILALIPLLVACQEGADMGSVEDDELLDEDGLPYERLPVPPAAECAQRWSIPTATANAGNNQYVAYQGAVSCSGGSSAGARALAEHLENTFPGTAGYGIYDCRSIAGSASLSLHSEGRAIDLMIPLDYSQSYGANNRVGDVIGNWLIENAQAIGIQRIIWDRTIWDADNAVPKDHCVDISNPHWDHLHIELSWDGANQLTPWFHGGATTPAPVAEPDPYTNQWGSFVIDSNNAYNTWAWNVDVPASWSSSTAYGPYWNTGYWKAPTAFWGLDFADFIFLRGEPGCVSGWAWWPNSPTHAPDTFIIAYHEPAGHISGYDAGLVELGRATVDQRVNGGQWNYLGSWNFPAGTNKISVDRWTNSLVGEAVADAIQMIPSGLCAFTPEVAGQFVIDDHNPNNDTSRYYFSAPASWNYKTWVVPSWQFGFWQAPTSYWGLDFADFQFNVSTPTCYAVDAWWPAHAGYAPDTYMIAYHEPMGAIDGWNAALMELGRASVDQRTNGSKWNRLGTWRFPAGWNKISIDRWTESLVGWAAADAVRLTPSSECPAPCPDTDRDGALDCEEACPNDPGKTIPGTCGCGQSDADADGDGLPACFDACPTDPAKAAPGSCGCGVADTNTDGDAQPDCLETCDTDPAKTAPGACGCGVPDTNTDGDAQPDCLETCDTDPAKTAPGACGCGVPDTNTDGDAQPDCLETCDTDPAKTAPGVCGCGAPDRDLDGNGSIDCVRCGDGAVQAPEVCDDGGQAAGDGCSATCQPEALVLDAVNPGTAGVSNRFRARNVANGTTVAFVLSANLGSTPVPGCPGVTVPLSRPVVIGTPRGQGGEATFDVQVPGNVAGRAFAIVAVDLSTCRVSTARFETF
jgi:cysteine-rich repeat protein